MADHAAEHAAYPVGLRLSGRRVVVLGAGQVAQRRLLPSSPRVPTSC